MLHFAPRTAVSWPMNLIPESEYPNALKPVIAAKSYLGQNLSAGSGVPPYIGCAVSVNKVHTKAFGESIGGGASTAALYRALLQHPDFLEVCEPEARPGTIVICPTGFGTKPSYPHGRVGFLGNGICANDSGTGEWRETYDIPSWKQQFEVVEGYPTNYFQRI